MSKTLLNIVIFAVIGFALGYAIFGKWGGDYVSLKTLFSFGGNRLENAFRSVAGIEDIRNKILICGAVGAVVGGAIASRK
ncbi:MAG: hypothetical protein Q8L69_11290 [Gallionellaceae bacterium]|nr:hypothetical protein [Gallionellaceae bacterium]